MLFYFSILAFFSLLCLILYRFRAQVIPHLPASVTNRFPTLNNYTRLGPSTWADQANAGLSSRAFDIEANLRDGDSRAGLDEVGTQEVMDIMRRERIGFDQARLIRHNQILARNGIDPSGIPMDSKAVTRL